MVSTDRGDLGTEFFSVLFLVMAFRFGSLLLGLAMLNKRSGLVKVVFLLSDYQHAMRSYGRTARSKIDVSRGCKCRSPGSRAMNRFCKSPA